MSTPWSRREFPEFGAAAGVSLAAKPLTFRPLAPSDTVRFGMVGVGMQGSGLLGTSIGLPGVTCAGAADSYDGRHTLAKEIAGANLPTTRRYQQLLDDKNVDCIVEDVVFGHHAALACHMANEAYFRSAPVTWDAASKTIK